MPFLEVRNLSVYRRQPCGWFDPPRPSLRLLEDVSFEVMENTCMGLVGERGSGKMALTEALLRLIPARSGEVIYAGRNLLRARGAELRALRKQIQPLFPDSFGPLNPRLTLAQAVREPVEIHFSALNPYEMHRRAEQAMIRARLPKEAWTLYPHETDAGPRQRAVLARALALEPRLLICHDFVHGLDIGQQSELLNLLKTLREDLNMTYLFVTHDLAIADHMSDHIVILHRGKVLESASPEDIVRRPSHDYTRRLVSSTTTVQ